MPDLKKFDNIVEVIKYLCPSHILGECLEKEGVAVNYQRNDFMQMPDGRIAAICNTGNFSLYRGEHKIYKTSKASLYRIKERNDRICALAKTYEFMEFLKSLPEVQEYIINNMWYEPWALAQHYEFSTPMMDLTNEIAVAAFFATHRYDGVTKQYVLEREGTGCIRVTSMLDNLASIEMKRIRPIGVQPFSRPSNQYGYELWLPEDEDFIDQSVVVEFEQNYEVNHRLESAMAIPQNMYFPNELIVQMASFIKKENVVTTDAISSFVEDIHNNKSFIYPVPTEDEIIKVLKEKGIFIVDAPVICPQALPPQLQVFSSNQPVVDKRSYVKGTLNHWGQALQIGNKKKKNKIKDL